VRVTGTPLPFGHLGCLQWEADRAQPERVGTRGGKCTAGSAAPVGHAGRREDSEPPPAALFTLTLVTTGLWSLHAGFLRSLAVIGLR